VTRVGLSYLFHSTSWLSKMRQLTPRIRCLICASTFMCRAQEWQKRSSSPLKQSPTPSSSRKSLLSQRTFSWCNRLLNPSETFLRSWNRKSKARWSMLKPGRKMST
jgi:hypothetical protein